MQSQLKHITEKIKGNTFYLSGGCYRQVSLKQITQWRIDNHKQDYFLDYLMLCKYSSIGSWSGVFPINLNFLWSNQWIHMRCDISINKKNTHILLWASSIYNLIEQKCEFYVANDISGIFDRANDRIHKPPLGVVLGFRACRVDVICVWNTILPSTRTDSCQR